MKIDTIGTSGPMILAVHGGPGTDHRLFRPELDALARFARVAYFDLPGHGEADSIGDFSLEAMAGSLETVRQKVGAERVIPLGSSYGGFLSLAYALAYPKRVERLILVDTAASSAFREASAAIARARATPAQLASLERLWEDGLRNDADFHANWRVVFPLYFARTSQATVEAFAERTSYTLATRRAILPTFKDYDLTARLGEVAVPALVIVGERDWITPPSQARALAAALPNAQLVEFEGVGHYPFLEETERFTSVVEAFLRA